MTVHLAGLLVSQAKSDNLSPQSRKLPARDQSSQGEVGESEHPSSHCRVKRQDPGPKSPSLPRPRPPLLQRWDVLTEAGRRVSARDWRSPLAGHLEAPPRSVPRREEDPWVEEGSTGPPLPQQLCVLRAFNPYPCTQMSPGLVATVRGGTPEDKGPDKMPTPYKHRQSCGGVGWPGNV